MVSTIRQLLLFVLLLYTTSAQAAVSAEVDRRQLTVGDTLRLTIRVDDSGAAAPDLSALDENFERLGTTQSSRHMIRNGRAESWTEWQVTLLPRRSGSLTIPSIEVAGTRSEPIAVEVSPAPPTNAAERQAVFVEAEVSSERVYVGQQLLFTVRVFAAVQLNNQSLNEPAFDTALVRQLGHHRFRRQIGGDLYQVNEILYAIFPQQPGELIIPEVVFSAVEQVGRRSLFSLPGQGRSLRRMSQQFAVQVLPIPAEFPADAAWLPARNLRLEQRWSSDPESAEVGESLTRTLTLRAEGVTAGQLPEVPMPDVPELKLYPDQPELETLDGDSGVTAVSETGIAIIPTRPGLITLPARTIPWWDVEQDRLRELTIPAVTLRVSPAPAGLTQTAPPPAPTAQTQAPATATAQTPAADTPAAAGDFRWQLLALLTSLGWLLTLALWWYRSRRRRVEPAAPVPAQRDRSEKSAFRALSQRCKSGDAAGAREALLTWARQHWQRRELNNLEQVAACSDEPALRAELQTLNQRLYGGDQTPWQGDKLLAAVKRERQRKPAAAQGGSALPPLYPKAE